jgi:hypothetical protein
MRISKSKAKELYMLNDTDLETLDVVTTTNYMNHNNTIKLYDENELFLKAIDKYGDINHINIIRINKELESEKKRIKKLKFKLERKNKLLAYFKSEGYTDEDDIISEYPCYLFIEYNENKFIKEVNNKIKYDVIDIFYFSIARINRRNKLKQVLRNNDLNYRIGSSIIDKYIDNKISLEETLKIIEENKFLWEKTLYGFLRRNNYKNLNSVIEKNDLKEDVLYYHLLTSKSVNFPESLNNIIEKILKTFLFFKDKNISIDLVSKSDDLFTQFINTIKLRNVIIYNNRNSIHLPEFIKNRLDNRNNIYISYE